MREFPHPVRRFAFRAVFGKCLMISGVPTGVLDADLIFGSNEHGRRLGHAAGLKRHRLDRFTTQGKGANGEDS